MGVLESNSNDNVEIMRFWTREVSMGMARRNEPRNLEEQNERCFLTNDAGSRGMTTKALAWVNQGRGKIMKFVIPHKREERSDLRKEINSLWTCWVLKAFRTYNKQLGIQIWSLRENNSEEYNWASYIRYQKVQHREEKEVLWEKEWGGKLRTEVRK